MINSQYKPIFYLLEVIKGHWPYLKSIDFINTWKIKDINEILVSENEKNNYEHHIHEKW